MNTKAKATPIRGEGGRFRGTLPAVRPTNLKEKRCSKCRNVWPISEYCRQRTSVDGYSWWCRSCKNESVRLSREGRQLARGNLARMRGATLLARVVKLIEAAREARSTGMWRGRDAIRAYAKLGRALEAIGVPAPPDREALVKDFKPQDRDAELDPPPVETPLLEDEP